MADKKDDRWVAWMDDATVVWSVLWKVVTQAAMKVRHLVVYLVVVKENTTAAEWVVVRVVVRADEKVG
jgi:hypothetical protein